jgi:hypothetical protein
MSWDGRSVPEGKYRLRWVMRDEEGHVISLSAWTPQDEGSFSKAIKPSGTTVTIEGEHLKKSEDDSYELVSIVTKPTDEIDSIEYLVLLVNGDHKYSGMGFVKNNCKTWALSNGEIFKEGEK